MNSAFLQFNGFIATLDQNGTGISIDSRNLSLNQSHVTTILSHNRLNVSVKGITGTTPVMVSLINSQGRTVSSTKVQPVAAIAQGSLNLKQIPAGSYMVRIRTGEKNLYTGQCLITAK